MYRTRLALGALVGTVGVLLGACADDALGPGGNVVLQVPFQFAEDATGLTGFRLMGVNGSITISGRSQGEAFEVSGFRRVSNCALSEAEALIDDLEVSVTVSAGDIVVQTTQPTFVGACNLVVEYELAVPDRLAGRVTNLNGAISVDGLDGGIDITNINGNVELTDVEDDVTVRLTNGMITAAIRPSGVDEIDLLTVNGGVEVTTPTITNAFLAIQLVNGTITVENLTVTNPTSTATSFSGTLGTGEALINLRTTNGSISLVGI